MERSQHGPPGKPATSVQRSGVYRPQRSAVMVRERCLRVRFSDLDDPASGQPVRAHVRKGESGASVVFASHFTKVAIDAGGAEIECDIPFLNDYTVFNCEQIDDLPDHYYSAPNIIAKSLERIEQADRFFDNTGAVIRYGGNQAYYSPPTDHIQLPEPAEFRDVASFIATRAHETLHWTSAAHRLNRDLSRYHKDQRERAFEEMLVELGAAMICADLGIVPELEPRPDHAAYIQAWAAILGSDTRAIFQAAAHAQRAVAYLHSLQPSATSEGEAT